MTILPCHMSRLQVQAKWFQSTRMENNLYFILFYIRNFLIGQSQNESRIIINFFSNFLSSFSLLSTILAKNRLLFIHNNNIYLFIIVAGFQKILDQQSSQFCVFCQSILSAKNWVKLKLCSEGEEKPKTNISVFLSWRQFAASFSHGAGKYLAIREKLISRRNYRISYQLID